MMHNGMCRCGRCQGGAAEVFEVLAFSSPAPFGEAEEMELAMELLSVASEAEMDQFLGKVFKKAWKGIRKIGSAVVKPLGSVLKGVAKAALPWVGGALGSFIPIPGVGTMVGKLAGNALASALETELAGAGRDERELEMALRFVRIAGAAADRAARASPGQSPDDVLRWALDGALRGHLRTLPQPVIGRWRQRRMALRGR
jgi:hypothetical protein